LRRRAWSAALLAGLACRAWAGGGVELRALAGPGQAGGGASASVGLGAQGWWTLAASDDYLSVTGTAPSLTDDASLSLAYADGSPWQSRLGVDFSDDSVNKVVYVGPSFGLSYAAPGGGDDEDSPWTLSADATVHGYQVDLGANAAQKQTRAGVPYSLQSHGTEELTQLCPTLGVELPCFGGALGLNLGYGHDLYDHDPVQAASLIARRLTVGSGGARAGTLVGALYTDSASAGASLKLGAGLSLGAELSDSQLVSPAVWAQACQASLAGAWGAFSAKAEWDATVQPGASAASGTLSVGLSF
jgi:hypothetical protein